MNLRKLLILLLALVVLISVVGCGENAAPALEFADMHATESPALPLNKIVIYNSGLCTVLEAFGKTDTIVGAYGSLAETYGVPSCGKWNEVDVEAVITTGAEAVFCYAKYTTEEQISKLSAAGITCYFIELSDADTAVDEVAQLGELFGCQEKAQAFVELYRTYDALLEEKLATVSDPLHAYVEGTAKEPFKTANHTTAAHKLVEGAGLLNVYADNETAYSERNLEAVITAEPDVIVKLCASNIAPADAYDEYVSGLAGVATADAGKVILLNNEVGTTAIGSIIGRLYIAKFAYPDLFADVNVDEIYEELYLGFLGVEFPGSGVYMK